MCILFIAIEQHQDYPLIIAANRDEFYTRPTDESGFWREHQNLLSGIDKVAGGTWMGVTKEGFLSALTNVRDPQRIDPDARSRGELVSNFLLHPVENQQYLSTLSESKASYNGYNLLFGHWQDMWVYNNHTEKTEKLLPGVYGLSNASLNSPWPKINRGVTNLKNYCGENRPIDPAKLFSLLRDDTVASDDLLPKTGVPIEWERKLSSIFITSKGYGTRSSTLLLIDKNNRLTWKEQSYNSDGDMFSYKNFQFDIN